MSELDECREALQKEIAGRRADQKVQTILRAALIEACGGDRMKAGELYQKHDERIERRIQGAQT